MHVFTCCDVCSPFRQNYLSSRGKSWRDLRQEALQSLEQGNYYLTGDASRLNSYYSLCGHTKSALSCSSSMLPVRLPHLHKCHPVLLLWPASIQGARLQVQTEHPFIWAARSDTPGLYWHSCLLIAPQPPRLKLYVVFMVDSLSPQLL